MITRLIFLFIIGFSHAFLCAEETIAIPNPLNLSPSWWEYFSQPQFPEHIDEFLGALKVSIEQIEKKQDKELAETFIAEITTNLSLYHIVKEQKKQFSPVLVTAKRDYTLEEFLNKAGTLLGLKQELRRVQANLDRTISFADDTYQLVNMKYAEYKSIPKQNVDRLLLGLDIIAERSRFLYLQEKAKRIQEDIEDKKRSIASYEDDLEYVEKHIVQKSDLEELKKQKSDILLVLRKVHNELLEVETKVLQVKNAKGGQEEVEKLDEALMKMCIKEDLIQSNLLLLDAKEYFFARDNNDTFKELKSRYTRLKDKLNDWNQFLNLTFDYLAGAISTVEENHFSWNDEIKEKEVSAYTDRLDEAVSNRVLVDEFSRMLNDVGLIIGLITADAIGQESFFLRTWHHIEAFFGGVKEFFRDWPYYTLVDIGGVPITLMAIFKAIFILFLSFWFSKVLQSVLKEIAEKKQKIAKPTLYTLSRVLHYFILTVGALVAFAAMGLTVSNIAIILGGFGLGVGFGLQNIVNNFLCGLVILFERNVKIGDYVELDDQHFGKVTEVSVQSTNIHTTDGIDILLPNSSVISNKLVNWTKHDPYQRIRIPFTVSYGTDQDFIKKIISQSAYNVKGTEITGRYPKPDVWLVELSERGMHFDLVVWIDVYNVVGRPFKSAYLAEIEKALKANKIEIPYPGRSVYLHKEAPAT